MNPTLNVAPSGRYNLKRCASELGVSRNHFLKLRKDFPDLLPAHYHVNGEAFIYGRDLTKFHAAESPRPVKFMVL